MFDPSTASEDTEFDPTSAEVDITPVSRGIPRTMADRVGSAIFDTAGTLASGSLAAPFAGLAGILGGLVPGPQGQSRDWTQKVQETLTLKPTTSGGAALTDVVTKPFQWLAAAGDEAGQHVADRFGPAAGAAVNTTVQMLPSIVSQLAGGKVRNSLDRAAQERTTLKSQKSVVDQTLADARAYGFVVPPEKSLLRNIAGKESLRQEAITRNQPKTNSVARKEIDLPDNVAITPQVLEAKRNALAAPYRELSQLSSNHPLFQPPFKGPKDTLVELRQVRAEANQAWKYAERSAEPKAVAEAKALSAKAELLETSLEQSAQAMGRADLIPRLRDARAKIAKTYDIEAALNKGNANVDAQVLGNMYDLGKPLNGGLEKIAKFDQAFRRYTNEPARMEAPGGGKLSPFAAAHLAQNGSGVGMLAAGIPLIGGPARSLLLSDLYQKPPTYNPGFGANIASGLFNEKAPFALGALQASQNGVLRGR